MRQGISLRNWRININDEVIGRQRVFFQVQANKLRENPLFLQFGHTTHSQVTLSISPSRARKTKTPIPDPGRIKLGWNAFTMPPKPIKKTSI